MSLVLVIGSYWESLPCRDSQGLSVFHCRNSVCSCAEIACVVAASWSCFAELDPFQQTAAVVAFHLLSGQPEVFLAFASDEVFLCFGIPTDNGFVIVLGADLQRSVIEDAHVQKGMSSLSFADPPP